MITTRIVIDADGVLMDMCSAAFYEMREQGKLDPELTIDAWYDKYPKGDYNLHRAFSITHKDCWAVLDTPKFWKSVKPYIGAIDFANEVLRIGNRIGAQVMIATQATKSPQTVGPKMEGLACFDLPTYCIWQGRKDPLGDQYSLLIDDYQLNLDRWVGTTLEFPQLWNSRYKLLGGSYRPQYDLVLEELERMLL